VRVVGLADWDWWQTRHFLNSEDKVEGTSSLQMYDSEGALSRYSPTLNLPNCAVETYWKWWGTEPHFRFIFRNGVDVGSYALENTYMLEVDFGYDVWGGLSKFIGPTEYVVSSGSVTALGSNVWHRLRAVGYEKNGKLYAYVEKFDTEWVKVTPVFFDEEPMWGDRTINRVGIGHLGVSNSLWDSTSIYSITP